MHKYIARIADDSREQSLLSHLQGAAMLAEKFADAFGAAPWGRLVGMAHDIGKYSGAFQLRVRGGAHRVDHATAGGQELHPIGAIPAAFCVMGHHSGIPDGGDRKDSSELSTYMGRMNKTLEDYSAWSDEITLETPPPLSSPSDPLWVAMFTRMLYSCLVDADYLDTEAFMRGETVRRSGGENLPVLLERLNAYLDENGFHEPKNELGGYRVKVLADCISRADMQPGLFSLTVPTGGGKTIASLSFALNHAVQHGKERIIYVIPYCSIIDQTAKVFRGILGEENVLEHHSGASYDVGDDGYISSKNMMALATENWDMPIVVTTSVQFFESLYANRSSRCRKLHNIANSVVIFDEAQMLPLPCLRPCVLSIAQLVEHFGVSAVLCTATQPSLDGHFREFAPSLVRRELCTDPKSVFTALRRVSFELAGTLSADELAARLMAQNQVLCIVNRRAGAQEVFALLSGEGNYHLSTLMYPNHRSEVLMEIRERLKDGQPCRVVSTSLIEAGVDVDFPAVFREEAGLDSILQAAGRCNREGARSALQSIVTVFKSEKGTPRMLGANIGAMREAVGRSAEIDSLETIERYFRALLDLKGVQAQDKFGVLDAFRRGIEGRLLPFRSVAERFSLIETTAKTVYIPKGEGEDLVRALRENQVSRGLLRKLGRYGVSVYPEHFEALLQAGDIKPITEDSAVLLNTNLYSNATGLSLEPEEGKGFIH